ncbi:sodium- and chloride-dependent GABA transporter ine-like protein [Leptotrombidium deliense]|uniref:Sodium-and chloride-dependent GABA transporter ine-like protein n=1 Tax=Leptotrombidium deliense TaxID=299467 RepID=A0A443SQ51_9ACAR|nr:sodium- and chloride-dependent GABA transporter ine-like protein [Leptotrombidium deliense]
MNVNEIPRKLTEQSRSKSEGSDEVFYSRSQENVLSYENKVFKFIQSSEEATGAEYLSPSLLRSNSFTDRQIPAMMCSSQVAQQYLNTRRMSVSLPELRHMRIFPTYSPGNVINEMSEFGDVDEETDSYTVHDVPPRKLWSTKADFMFTALGYTVGLNNFWRFPYFCYMNDGGSFLIAYTILIVLFGIPLLCMEYSIGQLTQSGHSIFGTLCPILKGWLQLINKRIVISTAFANFFVLLVYGTVNSWTMFYLLKSFSTPSWSKCTNNWNSLECNNGSNLVNYYSRHYSSNYTLKHVKQIPLGNSSLLNVTQYSFNSSYYSSQEFFDRKLLSMSTETSGLGIIRWELAVIIAVIWIIIFVTVRKNIHLASHPTYALAILPFTLVFILFLRTLMLNDMKDGLVYLFKPTAEGFMKPEVWLYALSLCIHSLGSVLGTSVASAKCNREKNNFLRDAFLVCFMNIFVTVAFGSIVFGTLGYLSKRRGVSITNVVPKEPGFAFVVYSEHLLTMPFKTVWSVIFFLFMFSSGVHYQNGMSVIVVLEKFITVWLTIIIAFFEVILVGWFYGGRKLSQIIKLKTSKALGCYLPFCWSVWTPIVLMVFINSSQVELLTTLENDFQAIIMVNAVFNKQLVYNGFKHFFILRIIGLALLLCGLLILPIMAVMEVINTPKTTIVTRILNTCKPRNETNELKTAVIYANDALLSTQEQQPSIFAKIEYPKDDLKQTPVTFSLIAGLDRETTI